MTPALDLNAMQVFTQVAQTRSFTEAARRLGLPKSTVSRTLRRLEQRLGAQLVERTTRRVALTEIGALYLTRCERVLDEAEEADLAVSALQVEPRGRLRVGAPVPFARWILGPILAEFLARYPNLQLYLEMQEGDGAVLEGRLDVLIRAGSLEDSALRVKPLMQVLPELYASPEYVAEHGWPLSPADLRAHQCIATTCDTVAGEPGALTTWRLRRGSERAEVQVEARVAVADPSMNLQLAVAGIGVALVSRGLARPYMEAGRLVRLLPEWTPEPVDLYALYPSRLSASPKVRAFLEFLRERADLPANRP
ncbi:MAG TPA: LysR family transcriptional regulator [Acidobacteriaceae bacterium]|jgi:DNA-binding transcriptional LysR family regulator